MAKSTEKVSASLTVTVASFFMVPFWAMLGLGQVAPEWGYWRVFFVWNGIATVVGYTARAVASGVKSVKHEG